MKKDITVSELEKRWEKTLWETNKAVTGNPHFYKELKSLISDILTKPLDIQEYLPTVNHLAGLLTQLDPGGKGSIFHFFNDRIFPSSVWQVRTLRMECSDLLAHLREFETWRQKQRALRVVS
jgi:hypothetical protein